MDMSMYMKQSQELGKEIKRAKKQQEEAARAEATQRKLDSVVFNARRMAEHYAPIWFQKEEKKVSTDIRAFFTEGVDGKPLLSYLDDGKIKVKFASFTQESLAKKSYGAYLLSLENPIGPEEAEKFAHVLIITIMAQVKLSKMIANQLHVENSISRFGCERLLNAEVGMSLEVQFLPIKVFAKKVGKETEPIELGKTEEVIGKETLVEVSILGYAKDGVAYITRTDWFDAEGLPPVFHFDLSRVYTPRA